MSSTLLLPHAHSFVIGPAVINTHTVIGTAVKHTPWGICAAPYQGLKSTDGLSAAKAAALRINLNVHGCSIVAAPMHAPSRTSLLLPLLLVFFLQPLPALAGTDAWGLSQPLVGPRGCRNEGPCSTALACPSGYRYLGTVQLSQPLVCPRGLP